MSALCFLQPLQKDSVATGTLLLHTIFRLYPFLRYAAVLEQPWGPALVLPLWDQFLGLTCSSQMLHGVWMEGGWQPVWGGGWFLHVPFLRRHTAG